MKKVLLLIMVATTTLGCTPLHPSNCHKTIALSNCGSGRYTDKDEYGAQASAIKEAVESQLADRNAWSGKKCRLHFDFAKNGKLENTIIRFGSKNYCAALKAAAAKAEFKPFPNEELYDTFANSRFDFNGK